MNTERWTVTWVCGILFSLAWVQVVGLSRNSKENFLPVMHKQCTQYMVHGNIPSW